MRPYVLNITNTDLETKDLSLSDNAFVALVTKQTCAGQFGRFTS